MRVLMKKADDGSLCCMEITRISYAPEAQELTLENLEDVVIISNIGQTSAQFVIQTLYREGKADLSDYNSDC